MFGFSKNKGSKGIPVQYYEGELPGFETNFPAQLVVCDNHLVISRIKPDVTVNLDLSRIQTIEIYVEPEFMAKYKGTTISTSKAKGIQKEYYVFNYTSQAGQNAKLVFWGTAAETLKIMKLRDTINNSKAPTSYTI